MPQRDPVELRRQLEALPISELLHALARRVEGEWRPEAYSTMETILRERGLAVEEAVQAIRQALPDPTAEVELVVVARAFNPVEAQLTRTRLEQAGITARLADENLAALGLGIAAGGVKVLVAGTDAEAARTVLAQPPLPVERECPSCGSGGVRHETRVEPGAAVTVGLPLGAPAPQVRHTCRCTACGHAWSE